MFRVWRSRRESGVDPELDVADHLAAIQVVERIVITVFV